MQELGVNGGALISDGDGTYKIITPSTSQASTNNDTPSKNLTIKQKMEVRAAMSSPSVVMALEMGIPKETIEIAIRERLIAGNGKNQTFLFFLDS